MEKLSFPFLLYSYSTIHGSIVKKHYYINFHILIWSKISSIIMFNSCIDIWMNWWTGISSISTRKILFFLGYIQIIDRIIIENLMYEVWYEFNIHSLMINRHGLKLLTHYRFYFNWKRRW